MKMYKNHRLNRWLGYAMAVLIIGLIIGFSFIVVEELKKNELEKVELYAETQRILNSNEDISPKTYLFLFNIISQNETIPVILTDEQKNYLDSKNLSGEIVNDREKLLKEIKEMERTYTPITVELPNGTRQYVFFKNSHFLYKLQYFPFILIFVIAGFVGFTIWYFRTLKDTEESYLWAGMAKETAHQIGTPLSSIIGWTILLREECGEKPAIVEIEKDIERLKVITERFSKIGSEPELKEVDIVELLKNSTNYLKERISKKIEIIHFLPNKKICIPLNEPLMSWVFENLIKNAADAIKAEGEIRIEVQEKPKEVWIDFTDTGCGIPHRNLKNIFKAGFTTKKRGWGLGLSLAKRIVKVYHKGKIFVFQSELNVGTTFRVILKKSLTVK